MSKIDLNFFRYIEKSLVQGMPQVATSKVATLCALLESLLLGKGGPDLKQVYLTIMLISNEIK